MEKIDILTIGQFCGGGSAGDFYISTVKNHILENSNAISLPHKHDFYLVVLFTEGNGLHEIDFTSYAVKPGSFFFLSPGQMHHWELSPDCDGYIFFHTRAFYELHYAHALLIDFPFFRNAQHAPFLYLERGRYEEPEKLFAAISEENAPDREFRKNKILSLLDLIYIYCAREYLRQNREKTGRATAYSSRFFDFSELVEQYYRTEKSPAWYAARLNITPKHLNRILQDAMGTTTSGFITDRVMLEAKREMIYQKHGFSEIAYALGYDDYAYFSRLFKQKTGETPSGFLGRYRKQ